MQWGWGCDILDHMNRSDSDAQFEHNTQSHTTTQHAYTRTNERCIKFLYTRYAADVRSPLEKVQRCFLAWCTNERALNVKACGTERADLRTLDC